MKYKRIKTDSFRVIPIKPLGQIPIVEPNDFKQIIHTITHMNDLFTGTGKIRQGKEWVYRDEPNFSFKLYKKDGQIHQLVTFPQDQDQESFKQIKKPLCPMLQASILSDAQSCRFVSEDLELFDENLYAFAVRGLEQYAINLEQDFRQQIKSLLLSTGKDDLLYSLTMKEVVDHKKKRVELLDLLAGIDPNQRYSIWNHSKKWIAKGTKLLYEQFHDESEIEKHQEVVNRLKEKSSWLKGMVHKKADEWEWTNRKTAENRYTQVELLFLLWTDSKEKAQQFQTKLQRLMTDMQGENELQVVSVRPDLKRVQKGQLQYDVVPQLCLYQTELSKFLYMPNVKEIDESFYFEQIQKTQIPEMMLKNKIGSLAFGRDLYNNQIVYMPRPISKTELDDRVKGTIVVGEQGSGKTSYLENQILETYLGGSTNEKEWLIYGRSVIAFEVADGALMKNVQQHIPEWSRKNVIILNHADTANPIYVGFHDVLKVNKDSRSIKKQVADTETKILLDSMGDDSKTVAVERYFKAALQASYEVGKGNLIDALRILKDQKYLFDVIQKRLEKKKRFSLMQILEDNATDMINDPSVLKTIKNRLIPFMADDDFMNLVAQDVNEEIDFYKWMNTEPYLVLIYLPGSGQEISQELRKFLFTHYFIKIWMLMLSRERIEQDKRKECLVVVDELHQVIDQRAIQNLFGSLFKEPRKYRFRFVFSVHGWSSFNEAGKNKDRLIRAIEDARPNLVLLKGGNDFFKSMSALLAPYDLEDFKDLMNMQYCGIFRVDVAKQTHIFRSKLIEPIDMRFPVYQKINLEESRSMKNKLGRPIAEVEEMIYNRQEQDEEGKACQEQATPAVQNLEEAIDQEFAALIKD
ncbi:hypothetical protein [Shimazuella kribbensis]|uniref:hypothetical protein n=1 Tax=Shimazuella kribbensis TaxID=139808 RepID=UPI0004279D3F|nr:hypothetical protein [Shimazuella kribbensis]